MESAGEERMFRFSHGEEKKGGHIGLDNTVYIHSTVYEVFPLGGESTEYTRRLR